MANFQRKRFAISVNLRVVYTAIWLALVNLIASKENSSVLKGRNKVEEPKCVLRKIISWGFFRLNLSGCLAFIMYMVSLLAYARNLLLSHTSGCTKFKMPSEYFWRWWNANISCWFAENEKPKNIHWFWSQVLKHWYAKANETSFRACPTFCRRHNCLVKKILCALIWRLHNKLSSEMFLDGTKEVNENYRVICGVFAGEDISERKCHG